MTSEFSRLAQAAGLTAALTTAQHILLAERNDLPREARYALGVLAMIAGYAVWARDRRAVAALLVVAVAGGLPVAAGYERQRRRMRGRSYVWPSNV